MWKTPLKGNVPPQASSLFPEMEDFANPDDSDAMEASPEKILNVFFLKTSRLVANVSSIVIVRHFYILLPHGQAVPV